MTCMSNGAGLRRTDNELGGRSRPFPARLNVVLLSCLILAAGGCRDIRTDAQIVRDGLVKSRIRFDIRMVDSGEEYLRKMYVVDASDLAPLAGLPIRSLCVINTNLADLTPLRETPLTCLLVTDTEVSDLSPLAGKPLQILDVRNTRVTDIGLLAGMPLHTLGIPDRNITNGMEIIREMKSLKLINRLQPAWFWRDYDKWTKANSQYPTRNIQ